MGKELVEKEIIITNRLDEIARVSRFIEEIALSLSMPSELVMSTDLAVAEIIVNIIEHGYPDGKTGCIEIKARITPGALTFQITDEGVVMDPFVKDAEAGEPALEELLTRGLGSFLIHRTMDEVSYHSEGGYNQLTLMKRMDTEFKPLATLRTNVCRVDNVVILAIEGRLDTNNAREFNKVVEPMLMEEGVNIIINCEQMNYISSSGLRSFLLLQKSVQRNRGSLVIEAMQPEIKNVFELTGCASLFNIV